MLAEWIVPAALLAIYAASFAAQKFLFPDDPGGAIIPMPIAAAIPSLMIYFAIWRVSQRIHAAPEVNYNDMDFEELTVLNTELKEQLDAANEMKKAMNRVEEDGWNPEGLREIVESELSGMEKKKREAILKSPDAQTIVYNTFYDTYQSYLPPIAEIAEKFVLWVGKNKTKSELCAVGEGGLLIPRRHIFTSESEAGKCEQCGKEIEETAPRWGVKYGDNEYQFCCPRCRAFFLDTGDRIKWRDGITFWEGWMEHNEEESDYWDVQVRCEYLARR